MRDKSKRNLSKKKTKQKSETNVGTNQLLSSCSTTVDIEITESRQSSDDEPTLTMAFTGDDSDDNIL